MNAAGTQADPQRAIGGGIEGLCAGVLPARHDFRPGVAEAVAVAGRHQRQTRRAWRRRNPDRRSPPLPWCATSTTSAFRSLACRRTQVAFDHLADIASEQGRPVRGFDAQHATRLVGEIGKMRRRVQEAEAHAVPGPTLPRDAVGGLERQPRIVRRRTSRRQGTPLRTAAKPPAWSLSPWLITARSTRCTPSACSVGTTARSPASNPSRTAGPMSYSSA